MGFKVDYAAMQGLLGSYSGVVDTWSSAINSVVGQTESIEASTNIAGNNADRMREYLSTTYSFASTALFELLNTFKVNYLLYTEAYSQQIDGAGDAHIEETELSDRRTSLQGKRSQIQQIGIVAESTVAKVQDLVALPSLDISRPDAKIGDILAFLDQLNSDVSSLEGAHVASDFTDIDALISQLTAFFQEMVGLSKEYKTNFTIESFAALASVQGLLQAIQDADDHLSAKAADVEVAIQHLEERLAREQAEREERERKAKWTKTGVNIAVGVVSAVAIVAFPAAAPLIGMASGIVTSAVSAAADEYVEHGWNMKNWDMGRIGVHSCIGALTGLISGCVPPGTGFVVKAGVKGLSSALEGAATTTYDQLAASGRITDGKAIALDALQKGGAAFAGSLIGGAIAENVKGIGIPALDMARDDPLSKLHGLSVFLYEGGKGAGVGVFSRGVSNLTGQVISKSTDGSFIKLNELDIDSVAKDMYSAESIGKDFVGDGLSGMAKDHVEWRTPDKDTGLTPIVQYKLGHTTDPETGLTPVVQDSLEHMKTEDELSDVLAGMEERNPSTGANARVGQEELAGGSNTTGPNASFGGGNLTGNTDDIDWEHTSNTPEELRQLREMEEKGQIDVYEVDPNLPEPQKGTPHLPSTSGHFAGERGNSAFYPNDPKAVEMMKAYGQDHLDYRNNEVNFKPFTKQDSPWGTLDCEVEIGHMTDQRENPTWEYGRRPAGTSHDPNYDLGNFAQADNALLEKIRVQDPNATLADVEKFKTDNKLTWHECADGKTMQLVPTTIHDAARHSGGVSEMKYRMAWGDVRLPDE